jgi:hypothetical protein
MSNTIHPIEPAMGGETTNSVVGGGFKVRVSMAPVGLIPLNPVWIMGALTLVFSIIPMDMPKIPSWASPSTQSSVWLLSRR